MRTKRALAILMALLATLLTPPIAQAQNVNPVYLDDAPVASEALARVGDHLAAGNYLEAARVLQMVLDDHAERVVPSAPKNIGDIPDPDLAVCARTRVIEMLLSNPKLLETYRSRESEEAAHRLEQGDETGVERSRLLTPAGLDAALRLAQRQIESARFETARLTLDELDNHPDRTDDKGRRAAALMTLLSRYLPREDVRQRAASWRSQAGMSVEEAEAIVWPESATSRGISALGTLPTPAESLQGIVSQPLWTVTVSPTEPSEGQPEEDDGSARVPMTARRLFALPTVADDLVILNDGLNISAWDRYTLTPRWTIALPSPQNEQGGDSRFANMMGRWDYAESGTLLEDAATVSVRGMWGAAIGGRALGGVRRGDGRVHFFRVDTGEVLWSADLGKLDPALAEYSIRGPAVMDEGLVLVAARRASQDQRLLVSLAIVALNAEDGSLAWTRTVASAGFPFFRQSVDVHAMTVDQGIIYRVDQLGVVGAYELGTGRPVWVRRMAVEAMPAGRSSRAWEVQSPLIDRGTLVFLTPDHRRLMRLDAATGAVLGSLDGDRLMSPPPSYLMLAGKDGRTLVAVGDERIASVPIDAFDTPNTKVNLGPALAAPGILGRVTTTGEQLLVPTTSGIVIVDAASPAKIIGHVDLDEPGNTLALNGQVIVADDSRLHTYLVWDEAERQLTKRMEADPKDASAAVTYAELAYRARRPERIMPAVGKAITAIDSEPDSERNAPARRRLFEAVHEMLLASLERPQAATAAERTGVSDRTILAQLTASLTRIAKTPDERIAQVMAAGRLAEGTDAVAAANAAGVYQRVLDDPALASATWHGERLAVRGDIEATRRIQRLIAEQGPMVYDTQSKRADEELAVIAAQPQPDAQAFKQLAARYPLAPAAVTAELSLARLMQDQNKPQEALTALAAGLAAAQRVQSADTGAVGELAGRLVEAFMSRGQYRTASRVLAGTLAHNPGLTLTGAGGVMDVEAVRSKLAERLAAVEHWPRIGGFAMAGAQLIDGKAILEPVIRRRTPGTPGALALMSENELSLWSTSTLARSEVETGQKRSAALEPIWKRTLGGETSASIVSLDESSAIVFYMDFNGGGRWLERVNFSPAEMAWRGESFDEAVAEPSEKTSAGRAWGLKPVPGGGMSEAAGAGGDERFTLPGGKPATTDELLVCMDEGVVVLIERSGRAAAYDTGTGELLWASASLLSRVNDAVLGSGRLVLGGSHRAGTGRGEAANDGAHGNAGATTGYTFETALVMIDVRTGAVEQRLGEGLGPIYWMDVGATGAGTGQLVVGHQNGIACYELESGRVNWSINGTPDAGRLAVRRGVEMIAGIERPDIQPPAADGAGASLSFPTTNGWVLGETLTVLDSQRRAWAFSLASGPGAEGPGALDAPGRYFNDTDVTAMIVSELPAGEGDKTPSGGAGRREIIGLTTRLGMMIFGPDNALLGLDPLGAGNKMLQPAPAEDRFVALETTATSLRPDGLLTFAAHQFRTPSCKAINSAELVLAARPTQVMLLDGLVCLTSAGSTVVIPAPVGK